MTTLQYTRNQDQSIAIQCSLELEGEEQAVELSLQASSGDTVDGTVALEINQLTINRPWMEKLAQGYLKSQDNTIHIPAEYAQYLELIR